MQKHNDHKLIFVKNAQVKSNGTRGLKMNLV